MRGDASGPGPLDGKVIPDSIRQTSLRSLDLGLQCMTGEFPVTETWLDANAPDWDDACP